MAYSRRRKYFSYPFVDRQFQFFTAFIIASVSIVNAVIFSFAILVFSREIVLTSLSKFPDQILSFKMTSMQEDLFYKIFFYTAVPEAVLLLLFGLFFTHRITGPIYGLHLRLKAIAQGKMPERMSVRKHYFLRRVTEQMNQAIETLEKRQSIISELQAQADAGDIKSIKLKLQELGDPTTSAGPDQI